MSSPSGPISKCSVLHSSSPSLQNLLNPFLFFFTVDFLRFFFLGEVGETSNGAAISVFLISVSMEKLQKNTAFSRSLLREGRQPYKNVTPKRKNSINSLKNKFVN